MTVVLETGDRYLLEDGTGLYQLEDGSGAYGLENLANQSGYIQNGSMTMKLNTFDFSLIDPVMKPSLGDQVTVFSPAWSGTIASVGTSDPVDRATGHQLVTVAATNTSTAAASPAPFNLSDVPDSSYDLLLEDGSGRYLLEDGSGYYATEDLAYGYAGLSVKRTQNTDGSIKTAGQCSVYQTGLAPGQTFLLSSGNQGYNKDNFTITQITETWIAQQTPAYRVEFGDPIVTMSVWANSVAQSAVLPIDSTKITDGAVTTPKLAANAVTADKLEANLVLASMIQGGAGPAHTEMDANGFRAYDASGNLVVNIPDDGSPVTVNAQVLAQTLLATGNATFQGTGNELGLGSTLQLDSSQSNPNQAPSVAANTAQPYTAPANATYDLSSSSWLRAGLDYDAVGNSDGLSKVFLTTTQKQNGSHEYLLELLAAGGTVNRSVDLGVGGGTSGTKPYGVCRLGNYVYVLTKDGGISGNSNMGETSAATSSWNWSGANTDNVIATANTFTVPAGGIYINGISCYMGGHTGSVNTQFVVWNASTGAVIQNSASFQAAQGRSLKTQSVPSTFVAAGTTLRIGWFRASSGDCEWGVAASGSFNRTTSSGFTMPTTGCSPYVCGHIQAYISYQVNTTAWKVKRYTQSNLVLDTTYSPSFPYATPNQPVISQDGTNIYIADKDTGASTIKWNKYDATMTKVGSTVDTTYNPGNDHLLAGASAGSADFGAFRLALFNANTALVDTYDSTGARQTNEQWPSYGDITYGDAAGDGARFYGQPRNSNTTGSPELIKHSAWTWTTASSTYWFAHSWYDSNATGGTHETQVGPRTSKVLGRRGYVTITTPNIPGGGGVDDPNNIRFYMAPNATDPGIGNFKLQATQSATTLNAFTYNSGGAADSATNTFVAGAPAQITSQLGGILLKGDGTARIQSSVDLPAGMLGHAADLTSTTANFNTSALADVSGLSVGPLTIAAGRRLRITLTARLESSVANDRIRVDLADGSNNTIMTWQDEVGANASNAPSRTWTAYTVPGAVTITYKIRAQRTNGTGNCNFFANAQSPIQFSVEDVGT